MANHECLTNSSDLPRTPTRVSIRDPRLLASSARTRNAARAGEEEGKRRGRGEKLRNSAACNEQARLVEQAQEGRRARPGALADVALDALHHKVLALHRQRCRDLR
jgi:hypothetical protein